MEIKLKTRTYSSICFTITLLSTNLLALFKTLHDLVHHEHSARVESFGIIHSGNNGSGFPDKCFHIATMSSCTLPGSNGAHCFWRNHFQKLNWSLGGSNLYFFFKRVLSQREVNTECCEFVKYRQFVFGLIMFMFTQYFRVASVTLGCNCFFKLIEWLMHYDILHYLQFINGRICVPLMVAWITEFLFTQWVTG